MNDRIKNLLKQLDDEMPGVRTNALEALREELRKAGLTFRDIVADIENAVSSAKLEELQKTVSEFDAAIGEWEKKVADQEREIGSLKREIATLKFVHKAAKWVKDNWKKSASVAAGVLVSVAGYSSYGHVWSLRSDAVNAGLHAAVASATWNEGWSEPVAARIAGEPYWLMYRGEIDASNYSDRQARPVEMRCLFLYAAPAEPDSGQYLRPSPRNFLGWVNWPEVDRHCQRSPNQQVENFK